ncbi:hypothetical protein [Botryobacter ruber]|uniref:hypothetical protein n=1 Tax=Botryobacter ruber TaxID=2171629 RepID=UPI0013E32A9E|nr:hypothetical protein [Botryobacter ruber]
MLLSRNYNFLAKTSIRMGLANISFFGLVTWLLWKDTPVVPLWGVKSMATHIMFLSFACGFIFCFAATKSTRAALRTNRIRPLNWHLKSQTMIDQLPRHSLHRAFFVSLMGCFLGILVLFLFHLYQVQQLLLTEFIIFNMIYAAHFAAGAATISVYRAMGDFTIK